MKDNNNAQRRYKSVGLFLFKKKKSYRRNLLDLNKKKYLRQSFLSLADSVLQFSHSTADFFKLRQKSHPLYGNFFMAKFSFKDWEYLKLLISTIYFNRLGGKHYVKNQKSSNY